MASVQRELWHQPCCPVCMVASASQTLLLQETWSYICSMVGLSRISAPSRKQPLNTGREHSHCRPVFTSLQGAQPPTIHVFLAPVASGLCHIGLCCWSSNHWNPWREGDLSAQLYKPFVLHQTSKDCSDMLTGDPWWNETSPVRNL